MNPGLSLQERQILGKSFPVWTISPGSFRVFLAKSLNGFFEPFAARARKPVTEDPAVRSAGTRFQCVAILPAELLGRLLPARPPPPRRPESAHRPEEEEEEEASPR